MTAFYPLGINKKIFTLYLLNDVRLRFILKCKTSNEAEVALKNDLIKIRGKQGLKSLTSFES